MDRDKISAAKRRADGDLFTAHHHWAVAVLNDVAPEKYKVAAQSYRDLADVLDVYAMEFRPPTPQRTDP